MKNHVITQDLTLLEALSCINTLAPEPLVLFVVDNTQRMVGTLTDGDSRRALINSATLDSRVDEVMHRSFNFIRSDEDNIVLQLRRQKELNMRLVPVLDGANHIVDIINLERYKTILPVDAVLMAGGKGERLRPLTEKTPKPLLKVGDKAIIDHNIDRLISYGINHISVTVNYLKEQLEEHFSEPRNDVQIQTIREPKFLGTIGSIRFVKHFYNDTILVMNSDVFTDLDFEDFYLHFKEHDADMSVCAVPYSVRVPYGIFQIEGRRDIKGLVEKPIYDYYANAGIYLIKRDLLDLIPVDTVFHTTDLLNSAVTLGKKVIRFPLNGTWIDIGNPQEYKRANELIGHIQL